MDEIPVQAEEGRVTFKAVLATGAVAFIQVDADLVGEVDKCIREDSYGTFIQSLERFGEAIQ